METEGLYNSEYEEEWDHFDDVMDMLSDAFDLELVDEEGIIDDYGEMDDSQREAKEEFEEEYEEECFQRYIQKRLDEDPRLWRLYYSIGWIDSSQIPPGWENALISD